MYTFRRFRKTSSLRIVNILGLSVVFACLLLSYGYVKRELSYDKHHVNADRMARLSFQYGDKSPDVRIYGNKIDDILQQIPEIEQTVRMYKVNTAVLTLQGEPRVVNDFYYASRNFFDVFSVPLLQGEKDKVLESGHQVVISERLARELFGDKPFGEFYMTGIYINGRQVEGTTPFFVSGVFKDMPETSHFHTDILLQRPDSMEVFSYTYLLLKKNTDFRELEQKITQLTEAKGKEVNSQTKIRAMVMPMTDIRLHSHMVREMEPNGNINYIYLVAGANLLLLVLVLFNLWLNGSLIFSSGRKYYQLLRVSGASSFTVVKDEAAMALLSGCFSLLAGMTMAYCVSSIGHFPRQISPGEIGILCFIFLILTMSVSLIPVLTNISSTMFFNTRIDLKPVKFSYANVKYMLTTQYALVIITVILAFGIGKQMSLVKHTQVGGDNPDILVLKEQPDKVKERFAVLKSELLKHPEIESVTASYQLPGDAIRDGITVLPEGEADDEKEILPLLIAEPDFFSFFGIKAVAGRVFSPDKYDYQIHLEWMLEFIKEKKPVGVVEEYVINKKAMTVLGFDSPEEAVGKTLRLKHDILDYIEKGVICGVTDDFNYTGLYETSGPLIIMQRPYFLSCFMVRFDPGRSREASQIFGEVWKNVNPDFPADYTFMNDVFGKMYRNELNAERLVYIFSLLCFVVADLGLIVFMAFIIRRRTKEIAVRKVVGAGVGAIIRLLNLNFIRRIVVAFVIAVPVAWYIMHRWLENFAYKTSLDWWIFALAGLMVLLLSAISVSLQSGRAATANPVNALKSE